MSAAALLNRSDLSSVSSDSTISFRHHPILSLFNSSSSLTQALPTSKNQPPKEDSEYPYFLLRLLGDRHDTIRSLTKQPSQFSDHNITRLFAVKTDLALWG